MKRVEAMKKTLIMVLTILVILAGGCTQKVTKTSPATSTTGERVPVNLSSGIGMLDVPDEIVGTPGGETYRANVHEQGVPDRWPEIETVETRITSDSDAALVRYRKDITTKAGEIRNNLLYIRKEAGQFDFQNPNVVQLYTIGAPQNLRFSREVGGGLPGSLVDILVIEIPPDVAAGTYQFNIVIAINDMLDDSLPCTVIVSGSGEPDALVRDSFGISYSADFFAQNGSALPDTWRIINTATANFTNDNVQLVVRYGAKITTGAGAMRNNIIGVLVLDAMEQGATLKYDSLKIEVSDPPDGFQFEQWGFWPHVGTVETVLKIDTSADVKPGLYNYNVNVEFEGKDYGTLPCTTEITE
jgi:hypothetical protein